MPTPVRGILACAGYVPRYRLDRAQIAAMLGSGGGKGTRSVASYDEDTTTMGFEAARLTLRAADTKPSQVIFSTVTPTYADRTNATAIHAALRLPGSVPAIDCNGSVRSGAGAFRMALQSSVPTLVIHADARDGLPTSGDEAAGGDGAAAMLIGSDGDGPLLAEYLGGAAVSSEFVDRWRTPGETRSKLWEDRFGEINYVDAGLAAWKDVLSSAGLGTDQISSVAISGLHSRAVKTLGGRLKASSVADDLTDVVGNTGASHGLLTLTNLIEQTTTPNAIVALVVLADGAEVFLFRVTEAGAKYGSAGSRADDARASRTVAEQIDPANTANVAYGKFLTWRGRLGVEPPRRPEPARVSSSASTRNEDWKFGFVATRDTATGTVEMPPARMSQEGGSLEQVPMADVRGTVATFTIDRMAYSPSPPIVFGIVDFDGGGRLPIELADASPSDVTIGARVEMTFRRLGSADGISNYFWKARLMRTAVPTPAATTPATPVMPADSATTPTKP